jgi:hypothetical protein
MGAERLVAALPGHLYRFVLVSSLFSLHLLGAQARLTFPLTATAFLQALLVKAYVSTSSFPGSVVPSAVQLTCFSSFHSGCETLSDDEDDLEENEAIEDNYRLPT